MRYPQRGRLKIASSRLYVSVSRPVSVRRVLPPPLWACGDQEQVCCVTGSNPGSAELLTATVARRPHTVAAHAAAPTAVRLAAALLRGGSEA